MSTICWNGHSGDGVTVMGSHGWLGAMVAQIEQFALKLHMNASMPGKNCIISASFHVVHTLVG